MQQMGINKPFFQKVGTSTADGYDLKLINNFIFLLEWNSITSTYEIQRDGTTCVTLMEQITNCILMEYQYKQRFLVNPYQTMPLIALERWIKSNGIPLTILTDGWMNFAFGKWN
jgi:hypothetical protein